MNFLYFYSVWLQLWSILYYFNYIPIPPLYEILIISLIVPIILYFIYQVNDWEIFLFILIPHILPLLIVDRRNDNTTIFVNLIVIISYIIFMSCNKKDIFEFYKESVMISKKGLKETLKYYL